jgi:hypothetical protein
LGWNSSFLSQAKLLAGDDEGCHAVKTLKVHPKLSQYDIRV